jgi:hypothetical protein
MLYVLIAVTFVPLNQIRRIRMRRKAEKLIYNIGIEGFFLEMAFRYRSKVHNRIPAADQL